MWGLFSPWNLWPLAYVALIPLGWWAKKRPTGWRAASQLYLASVVMWLGLMWWLMFVTVGGYIALCFYMGLYPLVFVGLLRRGWACLDRLVHWRGQKRLEIVSVSIVRAMLVSVIWGATEYGRGTFLSGFPWFQLEQTQPAVMIQVADLVGASGVTVLIALCNGLFGEAIGWCGVGERSASSSVSDGQRTHNGCRLVSGSMLAVVVMGAMAGYGMSQLNAIERTVPASTLSVGVVQTNVPQSNKERPTWERDQINFQRMLTLTDRLAQQRPDVMVWPETMMPSSINEASHRFFMQERLAVASYRQRLWASAERWRVPLMVGASSVEGWRTEQAADGRRLYLPGRRYNSLFLIGSSASNGSAAASSESRKTSGGVLEEDVPGAGVPGGVGVPGVGIMGRYDKIHRVPFGEYIPWVEQWPWAKRLMLSLTPYETDYTLTPGSEIVRMTVPSRSSDNRVWRMATPICFEDVIASVVRTMVWDQGKKQVDLLVNPSNDGWFAGSGETWQHEQIARLRCIENRVPMVRAVNTGVSGLIDSAGRITDRVAVEGRYEQVDGVAVFQVPLNQSLTLYGRWGDWLARSCFWLVLVGLVVLAIGWVKIGKNRQVCEAGNGGKRRD